MIIIHLYHDADAQFTSSQLEAQLSEAEAADEVSQRCAVEREKYARMRRQLAKKTRQVETLRRYIDDVPGRAELSQYQRRFIELYNQSVCQDHVQLDT